MIPALRERFAQFNLLWNALELRVESNFLAKYAGERVKCYGRTLTSSCSPQEPGHFVISVDWNDVPVRGSPFDVAVFDSGEELHLRNKSSVFW